MRLPAVPCSLVGFLIAAASALHAQIQPQTRFEGQLLPVVACDYESLTVVKEGHRRRTYDMRYDVRPGPGFADGHVDIKNIKADLDPLRNASEKERTNPTAIRFRYEADLVADASLSDCYVLLAFVTEGSVGTHLQWVGRLHAGEPRHVKIELPSPAGSLGTLHVFQQGVEVRTNQHPAAYEINAYYASLVQDVAEASAAELLKFDRIFPHVLTRDGRFLATVREHDAKQMLIVYDLATMKLLCETRIADADAYAGDLTWVSDHEVAYVAADDRENYPGEVRLHLLEARTGKTRLLRPEIRAIIESVRDHPEVLVVVDTHNGDSFYKYNVRTEKVFDFEDPSAGNYLFDRDGFARLRARTSGDKLIYSVRQTPTSGWKDLDDVVKQPNLQFNLYGPQLLDRPVDISSIGPDGDTLYVSTRLGTDTFALAEFSLAQGVIKRTIAQLKAYDIDSNDDGVARLLFDAPTRRQVGMVFEGDKPQVAWIDPEFAKVQAMMDATFRDHVNYPVDWSDDHSTFIYFSASDRDPGTYYAFRPGKPELIPLLQLGSRLANKTLAKTVPKRIAARDGQLIPAYVTLPNRKGNQPVPLVVRIHGGPAARVHWGFDPVNQFLASRGYAVLQVNYRGSSGYGAAFQKAGLNARLDQVVIDDIADCVRHLIATGDIDPQRIAVMGASFGGWATYISLARYPDLYRCGIAISAVSDLRQAIKDDRWRFDNKMGATFWKTLIYRADNAANEHAIEPYLRVAEIRQPVFIIHGEQDRIVDAMQARTMLNELKKSNAHVQARSFANASHTYWSFSDEVDQLNDVAMFLSRWLAPTPASTGTMAQAVAH